MSFTDLARRLGPTAVRAVTYATGSAGDVYLCHLFLVHAAQKRRGAVPRFIAQPPLEATSDLILERPDGRYSAVERAIRLGLRLE
jgi:hypothetical protein